MQNHQSKPSLNSIVNDSQIQKTEGYKLQRYEDHVFLAMKLFNVYDKKNVDIIKKTHTKIPQMPRLDFLKNLKKIQIKWCQIEDIQPMFKNAKYQELRSINLSNNPARSILPQINAPKLQELLMQSNLMHSIYNFIEGNHPLLKRFEIGNNQILSINIFKQKPKLQTIKLDNNYLRTIPNQAFQQCINIKILCLSYNSIKNLPQLNLPNLQTLNFNGNLLQNICSLSKRQYPHLKQISLKQNYIKRLCKLNAPQLYAFTFHQNNIKNVDGFMKSIIDKNILIKADSRVLNEIKQKIIKKIGQKGISWY